MENLPSADEGSSTREVAPGTVPQLFIHRNVDPGDPTVGVPVLCPLAVLIHHKMRMVSFPKGGLCVTSRLSLRGTTSTDLNSNLEVKNRSLCHSEPRKKHAISCFLSRKPLGTSAETPLALFAQLSFHWLIPSQLCSLLGGRGRCLPPTPGDCQAGRAFPVGVSQRKEEQMCDLK